jgi:cysteine-rich repeat protein
MRRCGDGWRENGSSSSPVEGCDDGNTTPGDGCDAMCAAEAVLVHTTPMRSIRASWGRPASAVDDLGNTLVTWAEFDFANYYLMARRYDRNGAPIDATPVMLGVSPSVSNTPLPTAQGLPSGWVISWPAWMLDPDMEGQGIAYAMVPISGAIPAPRLVNEGDTNANQHDPSIARLSSGFVIAWSSNQAPRQNIAIRYFNMDGTPRGPLSHPRPVDMAVREGLAIATSRGGDAWTLTYSEGFATSTVQAIEYTGMTGGAPYTIRYGMRPADDSGLQIFGDGQLDVQLGLASLGGSEWLAIWSRPSLSSGDRFAVQLSAGATRPPGLDRMVEHFRSLPIPSDFSMGRVSDNPRDGWIVTYTGGNRLYTTRLVP